MGRKRVEHHPLMSPRGMPDLRAALAGARWPDHYADATRALNDPAGELYWVTSDMTALAVEAAHSLPEWTPAAAWPAPSGLVVWDSSRTAAVKAMVGLDLPPPTVQACGSMWHAHAGQLWVTALSRVDAIDRALRTQATMTGTPKPSATVPGSLPIVPCATVEPIPTADPITTADVQGSGSALIGLLTATWLLMEQPTISTPRTLTPKGPAYHRALAREEPIPRVRLVDLRTVKHPAAGENAHDDAESRTYTRRWLVRGHWRQQPCGPRRSQRRPVWIAPHVKGPEGTPLVISEHVNVWRR